MSNIRRGAIDRTMNSDAQGTRRDVVPALLAVGGLDPTGGAGVLVDAAASRAVGVHPAAVVAVTTVQGQARFKETRIESPEIVKEAIEEVLSSLDVRAIKTGALGNASMVEAVAEIASGSSSLSLVVDPVVRSTTGGVLLDDQGVEAMRRRLIGTAGLVTPNVEEAAILTGEEVNDMSGMRRAAEKLIGFGATAVLIKGGHMEGEGVTDLLATRDGAVEMLTSERRNIGEVRGTGCALASLVAAQLARDIDLLDAVRGAKAILTDAIDGAVRVGAGPLMLRFASAAEPR